jgi:hypothetical protein
MMMAAALIAAGGSGAAQEPGDDQAVAALIEWTAANCGIEGMSPLQAMMADTIANGTDPAEMDRVRDIVRDRIAAQFETTEAACVDLKAHFGGG